MEVKATDSSSGDFIRIYKRNGYFNLAIDDIYCVDVLKLYPHDLTVILMTPFGKIELEGKQAKNALKKIKWREPKISL